MFAVGGSLPFPVHYSSARPMFGCYISQAQADSLGRDVRVPSYYRSFNRHSAPAEVFPHSERFAWNPNIFGPLRVPARGDSILLTPDRATLYHSVMLEEGHRMEIRGDTVLVDGRPEAYYVFAGDYFFMMGDNRMNSRDSRIFGFVPRDHIIGVVPVVLYSVSRDHSGAGSGFRWNRIFRSVR
jgi:signal peptidase I